MQVKTSLIALVAAACHLSQAANLAVISEPFTRDGMVHVTVSNNDSSPITGLLLEAAFVENGKRRAVASRYLDVYVNAFHDTAIAPGEKRVVSVGPAPPARTVIASIVLAGAVFEDGRRLGTDNGIRILLGRRTELRRAIAEARERLTSLRGGDLPAVVAAMRSLAQQQKDTARDLPLHEIPVFGVRSMVTDWIESALVNAPEGCGRDCVAGRIDYLINGLSVWDAKVQGGAVRAGLP